MTLMKIIFFSSLFSFVFSIPIILQVNLFYVVMFNLFSLFLMFSFLMMFMTSLSSFFYFVMVEISELLFIYFWFSCYLTAMILGFLIKFGFILLILQKTMFIESSGLMEWMVWSTLVNMNFLILMSIIMGWGLFSSLCFFGIIWGGVIYALSWANLSLTIFSCLSSMTHWAISLELSFWHLFFVVMIYISIMFFIFSKMSGLSVFIFIFLSSFPLTPLFFLKISLLFLVPSFSFLLFLILLIFASLSIFFFESFLLIMEKQASEMKNSFLMVLASEILVCLLSF